MMRSWLLLPFLLACHLSAQQVTLPSAPIVFGDAFELTVTAPADFDAGRLLPLVVELLDRTPAGASERWRFRARCYQVGEVTLPLDPVLQLTVATCLPQPIGELEWPSDGWLIEPDQQTSWLLLGLIGVGAIGALYWSRFLRSPPVLQQERVADSTPQWDALAALRDLSLPRGDSYEPYYHQLKAIVRRHCHARFRVVADMRTSEELVQALPSAQPSLQPCLAMCDAALFGGAYGIGQNHQIAKDHAIAFVAVVGSAMGAAAVTPTAAMSTAPTPGAEAAP